MWEAVLILELSTRSWLICLLIIINIRINIMTPCGAAATRSLLVGRQQYYTGIGPAGWGLKRTLNSLTGRWWYLLSVIPTQQIMPDWCFPATGFPLFSSLVFPLPTGVQGYSLWSSGPSTQIPLYPTKNIFYIFSVSLHHLTHMIKCHSCLSRRRHCQANQKMYGLSNYVR